ncbi:SPOR domain-containing protein [Sulfitobacter sp. LCG007]
MSYVEKQYVDSAGCAFSRGGVGDAVVWIPRLGSDRKVLCGFEPTAPSTASAMPASAPAEIVVTAASPASTRHSAAPARNVTRTRAPAARPSGPAPLTQQTRVVPRHVWEARQNALNVSVPKGYRTVWEDDRLNPHRAEQTLAGIAQTRLVWTDTVPRRLVDVDSGNDVTETVALVYPYTDTATQTRDLGTVTLSWKEGRVVKVVQPNPGRVTYSSRSVPRDMAGPQKDLRPAPKLPGRYVQVAVFKQKGVAMDTARMVQRLGLPVRLKIAKRQGKRYFTLVAGPFQRERELHSALGTVQKAGFSEAFLRN